MMNELHQLHPGRNREAMAWLHHDVLAVLHAPCAVGPAVQGPGRGHACGGSPFSRCPQTLRSLGVRTPGKRETPLSAAEIEHGVAHGLLGPGDGEEDDGQGFTTDAALVRVWARIEAGVRGANE